MLLVASETGHVYTFATRKLQPMITSEAGKQLIQTCLNSPDPPTGALTGDQRMSATGFEETELSYNIGDDDSKVRQLIYSHGHHHGHAHLGHPQPTHYGIDQSLMQPNYATGQASPLSHTQSYGPPHGGHTHHVSHPHPHSAFKNWIGFSLFLSRSLFRLVYVYVCGAGAGDAVQCAHSFSRAFNSWWLPIPSVRSIICSFQPINPFVHRHWLWFVLLLVFCFLVLNSILVCLSRFIDAELLTLSRSLCSLDRVYWRKSTLRPIIFIFNYVISVACWEHDIFSMWPFKQKHNTCDAKNGKEIYTHTPNMNQETTGAKKKNARARKRAQ